MQYIWLADCYRDWGKYQQAVECELQDLAIRQQLEDQPNIARAYNQLGRIYQAWGKYEQAIAHYQQSCDLYQQLGQDEDVARTYRRLGYSQGLLSKNNLDRVMAFNLLAPAEQNIRQAIQLNTAGDYKKNLAYDYIVLGLLWSERLRLWPFDGLSLQEQIAQFEEYYNIGLADLTELGQTVDRAEEALDMARAYLQVNVLKNLERAEELAHESLQVFLDYNHRKLEASARKLLGEIYLSRSCRHQLDAEATAHQFLAESLQIYRELDLIEKATEVEQLMQPNTTTLEPK